LLKTQGLFTIENENPGNNRAMLGKAIGQAGGAALSLEELERLQQIEISRFTEMGLRKQALENTTELQEHLFQIIFRQQQRY
jgi:hypothetical protein